MLKFVAAATRYGRCHELPTVRGVERCHHPAGLASLSQLWLDSACGMGKDHVARGMGRVRG